MSDSSEGLSGSSDDEICVSRSGMWSQMNIFFMTQGMGVALGSERTLVDSIYS